MEKLNLPLIVCALEEVSTKVGYYCGSESRFELLYQNGNGDGPFTITRSPGRLAT